jgi:hypothetical protein
MPGAWPSKRILLWSFLRNCSNRRAIWLRKHSPMWPFGLTNDGWMTSDLQDINLIYPSQSHKWTSLNFLESAGLLAIYCSCDGQGVSQTGQAVRVVVVLSSSDYKRLLWSAWCIARISASQFSCSTSSTRARFATQHLLHQNRYIMCQVLFEYWCVACLHLHEFVRVICCIVCLVAVVAGTTVTVRSCMMDTKEKPTALYSLSVVLDVITPSNYTILCGHNWLY